MMSPDWTDDGFVILSGLIPDDLIDAYVKAYDDAGRWPPGTQYLSCPELLDLCCYGPLFEVLDGLVGEPVALHLNLTGWLSTERQWHGDSYLNPAEVGDRYVAAWMALADIDPASGPFECLPGSHRWPPLTREDVFARLTPQEQADPDWPWLTQEWVSAHWERLRIEANVEPVPFIARRGDVLCWNANLIHRGSRPRQPGLERRAVIAHYSGARSDMPDVREYGAGRFVAFGT